MKSNILKYNFIFILFLFSLHSASGQDSLLIEGKVVSGKNNPVKDVSVSVEGADIEPVLTDEEGKFSIKVPSGNDWLIINPLGGYKSKQIYIGNRKELTISLSTGNMKSGYDAIQLIDHTVNRRNIISSSYTLNLEEAQRRNISTIDQAFQGQVPGMHIVNHSGMPGQGAVSYLRGIKSINATNYPLFIVDGMPLEEPGLFLSYIEGNLYNPISNISLFDVENITILKDASLSSIYGTKASNGIILIETLGPSATQTSIKFSFQTGINTVSNEFIPQLNAEQYKSLANEILISSPFKEENFKEDYPGLYVTENEDEYYRYMHNTNWQRYVFSNSVLSDVYFSIKGGSDIATYGLSVGYRDQGGVFSNSRFNRFNVRFVSNLNVFHWFRMKVNSSLTNNVSYLKESALSPQTSPVLTSLFKPPILNPYTYDEKGQELDQLDEVDELGTSNPLAVSENFVGENKNYRFTFSMRGEADIYTDLKFNTLVGLNFNTMKEFIFMPNIAMESYYQGEAINVSQHTNNYLYSLYSDNYFNYNKQFNSDHSLNTSLGFRIQTNSLQVDFGETKNLPANDEYTRLSDGQSDLREVSGNNGEWNWISAYNRINYKFRDKYLLNGGLAIDYSTRTGDDADTDLNLFNLPFGLFYSIGGGWRISQEEFFPSINGVENILFRFSYGITGNDDIGNTNALNYYTLVRYRESSGLIPGSITNRSLQFEKNHNFNAGFDFTLWGSRTRFTIDYFNITTKDMLFFQPLSSYIGYPYRPTNAGEVNNEGWEVSFFQRLLESGSFSWDLSSSVSTYENEVIDVKGNELVTEFEGGQFVTRRGDPVNSFYGYNFLGVYSTFEEANEKGLVNAKGVPYGAGDANYMDVSGPENKPDGVINNFDRINLGSPNPDFFGSISNGINYKQWTLNVMVQFVYGNEIFNYARYMNERMVDLSNQSKNVLTRWQYEGDVTEVPRAVWKDPMGNTDFSSRWIEDGSYVRLKNVTLGYSIPEGFLFFKSADFYITGTNLLTYNNYLGYDPEFSYSFSPMKQGIDYALMPAFRQFLVGIKMGL